MSNDSDIFLLYNLPHDGTFKILKVEIDANIKYIHIARDPVPTFCPSCGFRMHSKGINKRKINHPVMQDTTHVYLILHQRRWKCTGCGSEINESFSFVDRYAHSSNLVFYYVCEAMKDLSRSTASIARQFNMSDTQVHDIFTAHVDMPALPLSEVISIDEVFLDIDSSCRYALVIMDFINGEIIDILHNRWENTVERYFLSIPFEQRKKVKYIISDAYKPYMLYPEKYFPNSHSVLDSFHVIKYLNGMINSYVNAVMKKYKEIDRKRLEQKNHDTNSDHKTIKDSKEVVLLRDYRWVLLKKQDEISYSVNNFYSSKLLEVTSTHRIIMDFLSLDKNFPKIRDLKEEYIRFNDHTYDNLDSIEDDLDCLIKKFRAADLDMFRVFADYLSENKSAIIQSFTLIKVHRKSQKNIAEYYSRLSNGPMESFNRKPKDYKRVSRGFSNFDYTRNRILWATRKERPYLGRPKTKDQVHSYRGKKRGKYKK